MISLSFVISCCLGYRASPLFLATSRAILPGHYSLAHYYQAIPPVYDRAFWRLLIRHASAPRFDPGLSFICYCGHLRRHFTFSTPEMLTCPLGTMYCLLIRGLA